MQEQTAIRTDPTRLAYAAGLIDGEGCIHTDTNRRAQTYRPRVSVGMTEPALHLLRELQSEWGGTLYQQRTATDRWAAAWTWHMTGTPAAEFIRAVLPYLRVKREQARLALALQEVWEGLAPRFTHPGYRSWTDEAREESRRICAAMKVANAKGPRARAASTEAV